MSTIHIFGCGGHARSVADVLLSSYPKSKIIFVDKTAKEKEKIFGFKVIKETKLTSKAKVFLGIGDNLSRKSLSKALKQPNFFSIISKKAHIGKKTTIEDGCFIGNFCHIGPEVSIGKNSIINNGAIIEHEVKIGEYSHIGPNVAISGRTTIGDFVFIGVGATVINNVSICSKAIVGAGATVVNDLTEPGVYVGTPAKKIKN